jgi:hypothetical protein
MAPRSRFLARSSPCGFGGLCWLFDGHEPKGEQLAARAPDKDRPVDQPGVRRFAEFGEKIDRVPVAVEPASVSPSRAHDEVSALVKHAGDALRLQIGTIGEANLALDDGDPIKPLAPVLVGQFKEAEAFARKVERAVDAPELVALLGQPPRLRDRCRVDDPDQTPAARLRRTGDQS